MHLLWRIVLYRSHIDKILVASEEMLMICVCIFFIRYLLIMFFLEQTFPDEVLDLERSVRTIDLTHNKIGTVLFSVSNLITNLVRRFTL